MNKSKFLKKSLALLLAFMLVFAMIPLGALAAAAVTEVKVNGVKASLTGTTYTAQIPEPGRFAVIATVELADGNGVIRHEAANDANDATLINGVWSFTFSEEEKAAGEATFAVYEGRDSDKPTGTFTVKYDPVEASSDTGVANVELEGQYAVEREGNVFTVTAPYGLAPTQLAASSVAVTLSSDKAAVSGKTQNSDKTWPVTVSAYDTRTDFIVRAEDGTETTYTLIVVYPKPFSSFSIEGERHASQISRVTEDPDFQVSLTSVTNYASYPVVEVYLPYGAEKDSNGNFYFTPHFETNYSVEVTGRAYGDDACKTPGTSVAKWEDGKKINLKDYNGAYTHWDDFNFDVDTWYFMDVKYSDGAVETWILAFNVCTSDTVPAIKGLTIENYQANIEGDNITIDVPKDTRDAATVINLTASEGTRIDVVNSSVTGTANASDAATLTFAAGGLADGKNKFTLRVTAYGTEFDKSAPATRDYYLTINTAAVEAPKLNSMTLQDADGSVTLEAKIDDGKGTVLFDEIPYVLRNLSDMNSAGWKLFWNVSSGATITSNSSSIPVSGSTITASVGYLPAGDSPVTTPVSTRFNGVDGKGTTATNPIVVESPNGKIEYKVTFKNAAANRVSTLDASDVGLAFNEVTSYDVLTNENQTAVTVNNNTKIISAKVNYSDFAKYVNPSSSNKWNGPALLTTLPEGAEIYFVHPGSGSLYVIDAINSANKTVSNWLPSPNHISANYTKPVNSTATPVPLKLVVVSQALAERVDGITAASAGPAGGTISTLDGLQATINQENPTSLFSVYDFTLEQLPARTSTKLESVSVYDDATKETITGRVVGNQVNITLPYYFTDTDRPSAGNLYLDYSLTEGGQVVKTAVVNPADLDYSDGVDVSSTTTEITKKIYAYSDGSFKAADSTKLAFSNAGVMTLTKAKGVVVANEVFDALNVTAENGTSVQNYALNVTIAPAKEAAVLNSVTINNKSASPDAQGNVSITLPFGTEVTSLKPTFNVSENAYVLPYGLSGADNVVVPGNSFNFLSSRKFTVVSENGVTKNHYTITVSLDDEFSDVSQSAWYYKEVMKAVDLGLVTGKAPGLFKPLDNVTRGEFALLIARMQNGGKENWEKIENNYSEAKFPDVNSGDYYFTAVNYCSEMGYIDGNSDGTFNAKRTIKREEMAKLMCKVADLKEVTSPAAKFADDASISGWAKGYVYAASEAKLMNGVGGNKFNPKRATPRCEAAAALVRYSESK